jgi:hypothetical protein
VSSCDDLEKLIGAYGADWLAMDLDGPGLLGWNLRGLAVLALILNWKHNSDTQGVTTQGSDAQGVTTQGVTTQGVTQGHSDHEDAAHPTLLPEVHMPAECATPILQLLLVARKWRFVLPSLELFNFVFRTAQTLTLKNTTRESNKLLQRACDIVAIAIHAKYVCHHILRHTAEHDNADSDAEMTSEPGVVMGDHLVLECPAAPDYVVEWVEHEAQSARDVGISSPATYMRAILLPGEGDNHARNNGGVFATMARDILESQRPHVSADSVWDESQKTDINGASGMLVFFLVDRVVRQYCHLDWLQHNVFIDVEVTDFTDLVHLQHRQHPYIFLICNTWFVQDPVNSKVFGTHSAIDAAAQWFRLFWATGDPTFFDGEELRRLDVLPKRFTFTRLQPTSH